MFVTGLAVAAIALVALLVYVGRERLGAAGIGMAALRTAGLGALVLLLLNPSRLEQVRETATTVLLDASLSLGAAGGQWVRALDTARALAGQDGTVLRFGAGVAPFDSTPPDQGASRLHQALALARGRGGRVVVVSDGELDDWTAIPPSLLYGVDLVVVSRDTAPEAALVEVAVPRHVRREDSLPAAVTVATWGSLEAARGRLEITSGSRRLYDGEVALPPAPGVARRALSVPAGTLGEGEHVLEFRLAVPGDAEPRTDVRRRVVTVVPQPAIVVVAELADWEARFLARTLADVARAPVAAFARVGSDMWLDMDRQAPVSQAAVRGAARRAGLLIVRGPSADGQQARWVWPAGQAADGEVAEGDWYVATPVPASPLAGRLGTVPWDSVPPLTAVLLDGGGTGSWTALTARQGRRGVPRAVLVGRDSGGVRTLTTTAAGLWRWALRGGASLDAYRALVASGVDWLLESGAGTTQPLLVTSGVVTRGTAVAFRWTGPDVPDSLRLRLVRPDSTIERTLRFDPEGVALVQLDTGTYRWRAAGAASEGTLVVEPYSAEFEPRAVVAGARSSATTAEYLERRARGRWWLFGLVIVALAGEWAWRQRRGLP